MRFIWLSLALVCSFAPDVTAKTYSGKNEYLATGLSLLFPGLGHFYLEDPTTALGLGGAGLGTFSTLVLRQAALCAQYDKACQQRDPAVLKEINQDIIVTLAATYYQNIQFYSLFAAYRDARKTKPESSYKYPMPTDSLWDLVKAPFTPRIWIKPEVGLGLIGAVAAGITLDQLVLKPLRQTRTRNRDPLSIGEVLAAEAMSGAISLPVGIGEEALFRGTIQPMFSEWLTPLGGWAVSTLSFGAVHIPNAYAFFPNDPQARGLWFASALPFITVLGGYFGWVAHKNTSLKEAVALHTLYDFFIFSYGALLAGSSSLQPTFHITIPW